MEDIDRQEEEVLEIIKQLKPNWEYDQTRGKDGHCGGKDGHCSGKVRESIFSFGRCGNYYWIVLLHDHFCYAFKPISPAWVQVYSNLILSSPEVSVEYNPCRRIVAWAVEQDKVEE